ncbi:MAG: 4Fe-4S dicluster domain-containing protein [Deltaproteobacteria bacterium]|nr:4Fe-4S dicluster domain-containing protein [Deltaproteobacteria bacterium]
MISKVLSKERLPSVLEKLKASYRLYVPVEKGDIVEFKMLEGDEKPAFEFQNSRLSPKFLMEPQSEKMFEFSTDPSEENAGILKEVPREYPPWLVVGIRPCDAKAIQLVRKNFDNPEYRDLYWVKRFEAATLVGYGCNDPCAACFCTSVECGPFHEEGLDALMADLGEAYLLRALTEKGESLLSGVEGEPADKAQLKQAETLRETAEHKIKSRVPTDKLAKQDLMNLFEAKFWDDIAFSCINCGTCTFLCPTCWCFDIQDEARGGHGIRLRNWDACMFPLFTLHGSGHNPRDAKTQRVRQRFMHKLKYYVDKYGNGVACVGCGRCVQHCPVNIDIRRVFEIMNNYVPAACETA